MVAAIKPDDFYNSNNFDSMISPLNKKKFEVFSDPSHSWIKVKKTFLTYLIGDDWRKYFTSFSYERADFVYLEEGKDTATLHFHLKQKSIQPELALQEHKTNRPSKIRGYDRLAPIGL